jgi:hypothetical protein
MLRWLARLHGIDSRWLYLATVLVLLVPFVVPIPIPGGFISPPTRGAYETLASCPPDKVVVIDSSWDAGSASENRAQLECITRHLCERQIRFIVVSVGIAPFAPDFSDQVITPIAAETGRVYGRDWVSMGYVAGPPAGTRGGLGVVIEGLCRDFQRVFPKDRRGRTAADLPLLSEVRDHDDIHAFAVLTYQANDDWLSVISGIFGGRLVVGCMSIVGPYFYPYLDSGQLAGALIGNRGAAEYELLLGRPGAGTKLTMAGSFGNCAIILAALVGNVGFWAARRARRGRA